MKKFNKISTITVIVITVILIGIIIVAAIQRGKELREPSAETTGLTEATVSEPITTDEKAATTNKSVIEPIIENTVTTEHISEGTAELDVNAPRNTLPTVINESVETGIKGDDSE